MLIALFIATFILTGGGVQSLSLPEDFNEKIETAVSDEKRREQIQNIIDDALEKLTEHDEQMKTILQKGRNLNIDYTATETDFQPLIADFIKERKKVQNEVISLHFQLREIINEQEWDIIFSNAADNSSD
jgi:Arc/MetJ-type ribon-helix-helix transcriptional regulator